MVPASPLIAEATKRANPLFPKNTSPGALRAEALPDEHFLALLSGYRGMGGLARADEVVELFRHRSGPPMAALARWIVQRQIISAEWQGSIWLPLFQFTPLNLTPHAGLGVVLAELNPVLEAAEIAQWFCSPNEWLSRRMPAQVLLEDLPAVLEAARAERFVVRG